MARRATHPYHNQPYANDAIAAKAAHNRSTVAQDMATVAPFDTPAYIPKPAPDGGPAAVWFPPHGSHWLQQQQLDNSCGMASDMHLAPTEAVGPQLHEGMAAASEVHRVLQHVENIGARVEEAAQRMEDSRREGQQWDKEARSTKRP